MQLIDEELMYSEVYSFLNIIGEKYINKIPKNLFQLIKNQSKVNIEFDVNKDINLQLSEASIAFIAYLNLQYWVEDTEKERLINLYKQNDINDEKIKKEKYSYENIFKNKRENTEQIKTQMIIVDKLPWYKKIINKIKEIIKQKEK